MAATSVRDRFLEIGDSITSAAGRLSGIYHGLDSLTEPPPAGDSATKARGELYALLLECLGREISALAALGRAAWHTPGHE